MALRSFRIVTEKSVHLAEATEIPKVMIIAGPNGVGKSTILYAIKQGNTTVIDPGTQMLYQGPHRAIRRTQVQRRWLGGGPRWLLDMLGEAAVSGFEGLNFQNPSRSPDNIDELGTTFKHALGKIENKRQAILAKVVDFKREEGNQLDAPSLPDIYEPIRTLTKFLLPHLVFKAIDFTNEDNIRCVWKRADSANAVELDIDDLSSGEKSIMILFLPLLEDQVREKLNLLERMAENPGEVPAVVTPDRVLLIDEPELHLHPDLQAKILAYIRNISQESNTQFVITTHSPTILDQAFVEELFALSPPSAQAGENQLKRISTSEERLEALKELAGSTYFLTTGRVVLCIEGESPTNTAGASDLSLFAVMYPRTTAFTLVPTKGKGNVINTVTSLREHVPEETFRIRVRGLVDTDQSTENVPGIETLPVCMIENLLLDPEILYEYLTSIGVATLPNIEAVRAELIAIATAMRNDEISRRVARRIKHYMVRLKGSTSQEVRDAQATAVSEVQRMLPEAAELESMIAEITAEVDGIIAASTMLDLFRGKQILKTFYQTHISPRNISFKEACIAIARRLGESGKITPRLDPIFDRLIA